MLLHVLLFVTESEWNSEKLNLQKSVFLIWYSILVTLGSHVHKAELFHDSRRLRIKEMSYKLIRLRGRGQIGAATDLFLTDMDTHTDKDKALLGPGDQSCICSAGSLYKNTND